LLLQEEVCKTEAQVSEHFESYLSQLNATIDAQKLEMMKLKEKTMLFQGTKITTSRSQKVSMFTRDMVDISIHQTLKK
jgi:hypothetical protein